MVREDDLDVRPYFVTALRHWKMVIGITILTVAAAAAIGLTSPTSYEATTTVAVSAFGVPPSPAAKAYIDLATSENVLGAVARNMAGDSSITVPVSDLRTRLRASQGIDASLIVLTARDTEAERATRLADEWAAAFVRSAKEMFKSQAEALKDLETQLGFAQEQLHRAEADLAAQERRESSTVLQTQMDGQREHLADLNKARMALHTMAGQADVLRGRLRDQDPGSPSSPRDDIALLQLQVALIGVPAHIQFTDGPGTSGRTAGEQLAHVESLAALIADRSREADKQIAAAQALVLDTNSKLQAYTDNQLRVAGERDMARLSVRDLTMKASQVHLAAQAGTSQPRLTNETTPPTSLPKGTTRNIVIASVLGLVLGLGAVLSMEHLGTRRARPLPGPTTSPR